MAFRVGGDALFQFCLLRSLQQTCGCPPVPAASDDAAHDSIIRLCRTIVQSCMPAAAGSHKVELAQRGPPVVSVTVARSQDAAPAAVETLKSIMAARGSPVESKVAAARIILNLALHGTELEELKSRIGALEEDERKQQQQNAKGERR